MTSESRSWMETMSYVAAEPARPAILIVLAQNDGAPLDEVNLATSAGFLHQSLTGQAVETAVMVKHITDLGKEGFIERSEDGYRWQMTALGKLTSRQWVPGEIEPASEGQLSHDEVRAWRDRILQDMDHDVELAQQAGIPREEWMMTQSRRLTELMVLNRVLGEQELPAWMRQLQDEGIDPADLQA